jgi:hypothetical protein
MLWVESLPLLGDSVRFVSHSLHCFTAQLVFYPQDLYNRASSPIQGHPQGASLLPAELHPGSHPSPSPHAVGMTALLDYCFRGSFSHLSFNDIDRDRDGGRWPCLPPVWMDETLAVHDEGRCHRMHDQSVINTCLTGLSLSQKHRRKCSLHSRAPAITQIHGTL